MNSWKTTVFGLMAAIGGAVVGLYVTNPDWMAGLPAWLKGAALLLSAIGTAGLGVVSRDNDKTSEETGAADASLKREMKSGGMGPVMATLFGSLGWALLCCFVVCVATGCQATPSRVAYNTAIGTHVAVDTALKIFKDRVREGKVSASELAEARKALAAYKAAANGLLEASLVLEETKSQTAALQATALVRATYQDLFKILVVYVPSLNPTPPELAVQ